MALSIAENAAAGLPPIEETEEVWNEQDDMETMGAPGTEKPPKEEEPEEPVETPEPDPDLPPDEEEEPEEPELTEDQKKVLAFDNLTESLSRNPVALMQELMQGLSAEQRAALGIQQSPQAPQEPALNLRGEGWQDENLTVPEKFVKSTAHLIQDLPRWSQGVQNAVTSHERIIVEQGATIAALTAQVAALATAAGLKLSAMELTLDPNKQAAYSKTVMAEAQKLKMVRTAAATVTPKTPKNGGGGGGESSVLEAKAGESFLQLSRRVAAAMRANA